MTVLHQIIQTAGAAYDFAAHTGEDVFKRSTHCLADTTYHAVGRPLGLDRDAYEKGVRQAVAAAGTVALSVLFHGMQHRLVLPLTVKIAGNFLSQGRRLHAGLLNGALSGVVNSLVYTPFGNSVAWLANQMGDLALNVPLPYRDTELTISGQQIACMLLLFGSSARSLYNPMRSVRLIKDGWNQLPKTGPIDELEGLRLACQADYVARGSTLLQPFRTWMSKGDPCRVSQARVIGGMIAAPLFFWADHAMEGSDSSWAPLTRLLMTAGMGYLMYADSIDGNRARAGTLAWERAKTVFNQNEGHITRTLGILRQTDRQAYYALATLQAKSDAGGLMDATLDKFLMNNIFAIWGAHAVVDGDARAALFIGGCGDIVRMDDAKNMMRTAVNQAIESKAFTPQATHVYQALLPAEKTGKHKAGGLMTAVCATLFQLPLEVLNKPFAAIAPYLGENERDSQVFGDFVARGAIFYALNASKAGMPIYGKKALEVRNRHRFSANLKDPGDAQGQALAKELDHLLDASIKGFKRYGLREPSLKQATT